MKILIAVFVVLLLMLQASLWLGGGSVPSLWQLNQAVEQQSQENEVLAERNRALAAEVDDLKEGKAAIEERARAELGMIHQGETFYQVIEE
ncbi:MAG: cell division protein FtsB [Gammaproteobacteria bacterium]|nr:cell division protein FtsB [Gammaproteobacteria bacterium]